VIPVAGEELEGLLEFAVTGSEVFDWTADGLVSFVASGVTVVGSTAEMSV